MSEIKVNKISPRTACGTTTLGDSGDTFTIPSGVTITNNGTQTGFGRTGAVDWQTGSIKTSTFTAASGEGYFADTSSGAFTMNLPVGSAGAIVSVADYTRTFQTNNLTITPNGSEKIGGVNGNVILSTEGQSITLVYIDGTEGWLNVQDSTSAVKGRAITPFITATGGTITTSGDYKIHTFTGPGTFDVTNEGTCAGSTRLDYLVIAGGGSGGLGDNGAAGGGGAGGYRESVPSPAAWTSSPIATTTGVTAAFQPYPITIGAGGAQTPTPATPNDGNAGSNSSALGIISTGGGYGSGCGAGNGGSGGGGGAGGPQTGGSGNTPPVTPAQGFNGGNGGPGSASGDSGGGGGGATQLGGNGAGGSGAGGNGGNGATSCISASPVTRGGGGGGGVRAGDGQPPGRSVGQAGPGGGGAGGRGGPSALTAGAGTANTGGAGGGGGYNPSSGPNTIGAAGGSGIVIIRYKFQ